MTVLYQSNYFTAVQKNGADVVARCQLLSTELEAVAAVTVAADTFRISAARWDICRSRGGARNSGRDIPALLGVEAYLGSGPALRSALKDDGDIAYSLVAECVKGIIQSETYLYVERGYGNADNLQAFWKKNAVSSCHLYSNIPRITRSWNEYVTVRAWPDNLFCRFKTACVAAGPDGADTVRGSFCDSFHELVISLAVDKNAITACEGEFLRAPDPVCPETLDNLAALVGRPLAEITKNFIGERIGGPAGCSHMTDLLLHMVRTAEEARA
jgi:hypothetical protein